MCSNRTLCGDHVRKSKFHGFSLEVKQSSVRSAGRLVSSQTLSLNAALAPESVFVGAIGREEDDSHKSVTLLLIRYTMHTRKVEI